MTPTRREFLISGAVGAVAAALPTVGSAQSVPGTFFPTERSRTIMKTFGLRYPIFEACHGSATSPELAIAVAEAGAMGALASLGSPENARKAVSTVRAATKGSFAVNTILALESGDGLAWLHAILDAGAPAVQFSWGMPSRNAVAAIRAAGAKFGVQVAGPEGARAALDLGADYLVCQGTEAGGHVQATRGLYETLPLVVAEAGDKPVVASGGIGNGASIRKALLAGASAAALGTRFVATRECTAHPDYKRAIVAAFAQDTVLTNCFQDGWPAMHRVIRNRTVSMWEASGCPLPGKRPGEGDVLATRADGAKILRYTIGVAKSDYIGSIMELPLWAGKGVDAVKDVPKAGELVERLWKECEAAQESVRATGRLDVP
jgi:nitronate monooxygenase